MHIALFTNSVHTAPSMSDSNYSRICKARNVHEIVDDAWLMDCLSDDEVETPDDAALGDEGANTRRHNLTFLDGRALRAR